MTFMYRLTVVLHLISRLPSNSADTVALVMLLSTSYSYLQACKLIIRHYITVSLKCMLLLICSPITR